MFENTIKLEDVLYHFDFIQYTIGTLLGIAFSTFILSFVNEIFFPLIENVFRMKTLSELVLYNMQLGKFFIKLIYFGIVLLIVYLIVWIIMRPYVSHIIKKEENAI
jgi:large-conductance mechanosensitive channel